MTALDKFLPGIQEYTLEKMQIQSATNLDLGNFMQPEFRYRLIGEECERLFLGLSAYVLGESKDPIVITYPETWWDAVKERFVPAWLSEQVECLQSNHVSVRVDHKIFFPRLKLETPECQPVVKLMVRKSLEVR